VRRFEWLTLFALLFFFPVNSQRRDMVRDPLPRIGCEAR